MKKPTSPLWLILVLLVLVGGLVVVTGQTSRNVTVYGEHDHDHDGKPDHDDSGHH